MARFAEGDVRQAMKEVDALSTEEGALLLPPDQVERITSIAKEKDPLVKGQKTAAMIEQLLAEVEAGSQRLAELHRRIGIAPSDNRAFLGGGKLSDQAKQKVQAELDSYMGELIDEVSREAKHAAASGSKAQGIRMPRAGRLRV